jgi:hypothetical protein
MLSASQTLIRRRKMEVLDLSGFKFSAAGKDTRRFNFTIERCNFDGSESEPGVRICRDGVSIDIPEDLFGQMVRALNYLPDFEEYLAGNEFPLRESGKLPR